MGFLATSLALLTILSVVLPSSLADDRSALLHFMSFADPSNSLSLWPSPTQNSSTTNDYCQWIGVLKCDDHKRVLSLRLENVGLNGTIPQDLFSTLDKLQILSLRQNKLQGTIPPFSQATPLQSLLLDDNELSGPIPNSLAILTSLTIINLSNNHLSGTLPDSPHFLSLGSFSVSNNNLTGPIPPSLSRFDKSSFEGNTLLCGYPLDATCPIDKPTPTHKGLNKTVVIYGIVGVGVGGSIIVLGILWFKRKKTQQVLVKQSDQGSVKSNFSSISRKTNFSSISRKSNFSSSDKIARKSFEGIGKKDTSPMCEPINEFFTQEVSGENIDEKGNLEFIDSKNRLFELEDLLKGSAEILGRGLLGSSYKATLGGDLKVVVKRLSLINHCEKNAFLDTMKAIERSNHPNIMPLKAYFFGKEEKLLIYDYMPYGSLFNALHSSEGRSNTQLDWISRIKIAIGVASALDYIHTTYASSLKSSLPSFCNNKRNLGLHGNLKSSNVLLGLNKEAYVADFGMASLLSNTSAQSFMAGQRAPECKNSSKKLSSSIDVYSYGVLLLELLTGKMPIQPYNIGEGQGVDLPSWVESVIREEWTAEVFDHELACNKVEEDELVSLLKLAMACISPHLDQRPSMSHVIQTIKEQIKSFQAYNTNKDGSFHVPQHHFQHNVHDVGSFHHSIQLVNPHHPHQLHLDTLSSDHFSFSFEGQVSRISSVDSFQR